MFRRIDITASGFFGTLYEELLTSLETIASEEENTLTVTRRAISVIGKSINRLHQYILENSFGTEIDEINFFKVIKPHFTAYLIYFLKIYRFELEKPEGGVKAMEDYLISALRKIKCYFERNAEFYKYYRSGATYLDSQYFLRGKDDLDINMDGFYFDHDAAFSTSHDYRVSKIIANEMLSEYLKMALAELQQIGTRPTEARGAKGSMEWKESRVAGGELLIALYTSGVIDNSQYSLKKAAELFSEVFQIKIGNVYKLYEEIRLRKKNRTPFLDWITQNLKQRMDRDDEFAP